MNNIIAFVGSALGMGLVGGLTTWYLQETIKGLIDNQPWFLPVAGALVGIGAGVVAADFILPALGLQVPFNI